MLRNGRLVAFGTETVYGLGGIATSAETVARIFAAKNRPVFNPLISHFPTIEAALHEVIATPISQRLAEAFWPGPLTLILPRHAESQICDLACAGLASVAVRVPAHPVARVLLRAVGLPVAAPSANPSGRISPTNAAHVVAGLEGRIDAVLDTGDCPVGLESTVLDLTGAHPVILRPGAITIEALEHVIGPFAQKETTPSPGSNDAALRSPGMMSSHYAPTLPLRLNARNCHENEALLAFGTPLSHAPLIWNLSASGDLVEAAARLYAGLHFLDKAGCAQGLKGIAVMNMPGHGLGQAIMDRLQRAAAPRMTHPDETAFEGGG
ncbi:L-threonylcarbamoyladenylate synthase [Candidatus Kirkpatrickella diaphorinae]